MFPSGPGAMYVGCELGVGTGNSVMRPEFVILPILSPDRRSPSVNQIEPSGAVAMPVGCELGVGTGKVEMSPMAPEALPAKQARSAAQVVATNAASRPVEIRGRGIRRTNKLTEGSYRYGAKPSRSGRSSSEAHPADCDGD